MTAPRIMQWNPAIGFWPKQYVADTSVQRYWYAPVSVDPRTVTGVVVAPNDLWFRGTLAPVTPPTGGGGGYGGDGTQPTGPGIVRYQDLYRTGDTLKQTLSRLSSPAKVSFPADIFWVSDFADSNNGIRLPSACIGLLGCGSAYTAFAMRPGSSTKASSVPTSGTNPYRVIRTASNPAGGFVGQGFTVVGTEQPVDPHTGKPHCYHGITIDHVTSTPPKLTDVRAVGIPGSSHAPPGETFAIEDFGCNGMVASFCEVDGRIGVGVSQWYTPSFYNAGDRVSAAMFGSNSSSNVTLNDMYAHHSLASTVTFWQTVGVTTNRLRSQYNGSGSGSVSAHGINHERVTGKVRHNNPSIIIDRAHGNTGYHVSALNDLTNDPDIEIHDASFDAGPSGYNGCLSIWNGDTYMGKTNRQTSVPKLIQNGVALTLLDSRSSADKALADPTKNYFRFH